MNRFVIILLLCVAAMCGCTHTNYVPVESVRTEYRDREVERLVSDTVHDTRIIVVKGDTVRDWRIREQYRYVSVHDTCFVENNDTIRVPYPVERPLSRWEKAKMDFGGMAIGGFSLAICIAVLWLIKKFRK